MLLADEVGLNSLGARLPPLEGLLKRRSKDDEMERGKTAEARPPVALEGGGIEDVVDSDIVAGLEEDTRKLAASRHSNRILLPLG